MFLLSFYYHRQLLLFPVCLEDCLIVPLTGSKSRISQLVVRNYWIKGGGVPQAIFRSRQSKVHVGSLKKGVSDGFFQMPSHAVLDWHSLAGRMDESVTGWLIVLLVSV